MKLLTAVPFVLVLVATSYTVNCVVHEVIKNTNHDMIIPGGVTNDDRPASPEIEDLISNLQPKIKSHLLGVPGGRNILGKLTPISYRTQLVNGVNYFVKVQAKTPRKVIYYHLRIYKSFGGNPELVKVSGPKGESEAIDFF